MEINQLQNEHRKITSTMGSFSILESLRDESVSPWNATSAYFLAKLGVRRRQIIATLKGDQTKVTQAGAMQWMAGNVEATTGIKGAGDFLGKMVKGAVTKESGIKPEYKGKGYLVLDADKLSHKAYYDKNCKKQIKEIFNCYDENDILDRKKLGKIVFSDKNKKKQLENIEGLKNEELDEIALIEEVRE